MTEPTYEWRTRDQDYPDGWMPWTEVAPGTYGITCPDYADATDIHIRIKPGTEIALVAPNADRRTADTITDDDLDALYAERDTYRRLLHETVDLAELTHKYGSMGGHDRAGLNLGCAGCELRQRIRDTLAAPYPTAADTDAAPHTDHRICILCGADCTDGWTSHGGDQYSCCPACPTT